MFSLRRPITPDLSPNAQFRDVLFAFGQLLSPASRLKWKRGQWIEHIHTYFRKRFNTPYAYSVDSGRTALRLALSALELQDGDSVFLQAFTCVVVPNAVLAAGGTPTYVDIDASYNMDPAELEKALQSAKAPRAVIVQHTFGSPADMDRIVELCAQYNVTLIEDCAHAIGGMYKGQQLGTFGEAAIFSFGRDKVVSSVSGGMLITSNENMNAVIESEWNMLELPTSRWIARRLRHPVVFALGKRFYHLFSLGKALIAISKRLELFAWVLQPSERTGKQPVGYKLPNVLGLWALSQLNRLGDFNDHRQQLATYYTQRLRGIEGVQLPTAHTETTPYYLRYPVRISSQIDGDAVLKQLRQEGIVLGDWYRTIIAPASADAEAVGYTPSSCAAAEDAVVEVINLPTNILTSMRDAERVVDALLQHIETSLEQTAKTNA